MAPPKRISAKAVLELAKIGTHGKKWAACLRLVTTIEGIREVASEAVFLSPSPLRLCSDHLTLRFGPKHGRL
jgi:hypothetical protein